jgi:hypothetical protein
MSMADHGRSTGLRIKKMIFASGISLWTWAIVFSSRIA